jgi:hypothetical protein
MFFGAIGLIGGLLSTGLAISGAKAQDKMQRDVAKHNARQMELEAQNRERETAEQLKRQGINDRSDRASLRTRLAARGSSTVTGTALILQGRAAAAQSLAINDAARASMMQASALRQRGAMALWQSKISSQQTKKQIFGLGITGIAKAVSTFAENKYLGAK